MSDQLPTWFVFNLKKYFFKYVEILEIGFR